jgi:hypothetical protein
MQLALTNCVMRHGPFERPQMQCRPDLRLTAEQSRWLLNHPPLLRVSLLSLQPQAQARAHRIGQSRDVLVLRLLAENTIEEHILDVAEQKRKFADSSITGGCGDVRRKALEGRAGALLLLAL